MPGNTRLTRESFLYLAQEAGLDTATPHMDELFEYVQSVLTGLESLNRINVAGVEPDMAFIPDSE